MADNEPERIRFGLKWDSAFTRRRTPTADTEHNALTVIETRRAVVFGLDGQRPWAASMTHEPHIRSELRSSDVTVIDGTSHGRFATVKVGLWTRQIAVNRKTNMNYVVNNPANSV